jgi:hypothetical protein
MPGWSSADAKRHTKMARTNPTKGRAFAHAANSAASRGLSEGAQIRIGNAAARRAGRGKGRKSRRY